MSHIEHLKSLIETLPEKIGVYIFQSSNATLYVGKAANIKRRVLTHLQASKKDERERKIVTFTEKIDFIITNTETEALIEENILIKAYKPQYNVRLSDDKSYPYIKINFDYTYPPATITRDLRQKNAKYFGPYCDVGTLRESFKLLRKIFPIRICKKDLTKKKVRPCLYYHIGQCSAPCEEKISEKEYRTLVKQVILFLEGKSDDVKHILKTEMKDAAQKQEYEKAARLRDQIQNMEELVKEVKVVLPPDNNLDVIALLREKEDVCAQVMQVREGKLLSSECFQLKSANEASDSETLESFIKQYYLKRISIPETLILNRRITDSPTISKWLSDRAGKNVELKRPLKKKLKNLLEIAIENGKTHLEKINTERQKALNALQKLKETLKLEQIPKVIECYDISNLGPKESVGSKVTFQNGLPYKNQYRRFKIKHITQPDDQAMIGEIIGRRFKRLLEEKQVPPHLIIVDGGITQVKAAKKVIDKLALKIPIIGLAKKREEVYRPNGSILKMHPRTQPSLLLQQIRNEAHRFAIHYHRSRRDKIPEIISP
jgi:excinuclease ABC subunit C